jgi:hypothetical protein
MATSHRETVIRYNFATAAKDMIRLLGGKPPAGYNLGIEHAEIDTDTLTMTITYSFVKPYEDDPERSYTKEDIDAAYRRGEHDGASRARSG